MSQDTWDMTSQPFFWMDLLTQDSSIPIFNISTYNSKYISEKNYPNFENNNENIADPSAIVLEHCYVDAPRKWLGLRQCLCFVIELTVYIPNIAILHADLYITEQIMSGIEVKDKKTESCCPEVSSQTKRNYITWPPSYWHYYQDVFLIIKLSKFWPVINLCSGVMP